MLDSGIIISIIVIVVFIVVAVVKVVVVVSGDGGGGGGGGGGRSISMRNSGSVRKFQFALCSTDPRERPSGRLFTQAESATTHWRTSFQEREWERQKTGG